VSAPLRLAILLAAAAIIAAWRAPWGMA